MGPSVDAWLLFRLIIVFFYLTLDVFSITLCTKLDISYPLVLEVSHRIYSQPLDLMGIYLFHCTHARARMILHNVV